MISSKTLPLRMLLIIVIFSLIGCTHKSKPVVRNIVATQSSDSPRPAANIFWQNFQLSDDDHLGAGYAREVWNRVGGSLGDDGAKGNWLPCAGRLSFAINRAGRPIPYIKHVTYRNSDGYHYILRASDMRKYLHKHWGKPDFTNFPVYKRNPDSADFLNSLRLGDGVAVFASSPSSAVNRINSEFLSTTSRSAG